MRTESKGLVGRRAAEADAPKRRMTVREILKPRLGDTQKGNRSLGGTHGFARRARERAQQHHHHG
jgi:hypothetical protein